MNFLRKTIWLDSESSTERFYRLSLIALVILGLVFRLRFFLTGRSLWLDEAMLALNIVHRSFAGLFQQPMEYGQSSPIGYVISVKAFTVMLGDSEYALRLYSLLAGCAALILTTLLSKKFLSRIGVFIAVALFACGPYLIYYSAEVKQYISDVIAGLILLTLFAKQINSEAAKKDFLILGAAGSLLLWFSHPVIFIAAAIGLTLFIHYWINNDKTRLLWISLCGMAWGMSLAILYIVNLRHLAASELLLNYWQEGFVPLPISNNTDWFVNLWLGLLDDPLSLGVLPLINLLLFLAGIVFLFKKNWRIGMIVLLPLLFAFVASIFHKYPLIGRMLLFATPLFVIAFGAGVEGLGSLIRNKYLSYAVQILFAIYLIWTPLFASVDGFISPKFREHIKPTLQYLRENRKDGDLIYVYYNTGPAFRFYAPKFHFASSDYMIGNDHSTDPQEYSAELDQVRGNPRVWFIFSHVYEKGDLNEMDFMLRYLNTIGKRIREYKVPGTSVYLYLYDLR